jgi:hypothetical protein
MKVMAASAAMTFAHSVLSHCYRDATVIYPVHSISTKVPSGRVPVAIELPVV